MTRVQCQDAEVVGPGLGGLIQILGVEVGQRQMGPGVTGAVAEQSFEFEDGVGRVVGFLQGQREIVAGRGGVGIDRQSLFAGQKGKCRVAGVIGRKADIIPGV